MIEGTYTFHVERDPESGWYIATGSTPDPHGTLITQGRDANELFDMVADAYKCLMDVRVPWYTRWFYRITNPSTWFLWL